MAWIMNDEPIFRRSTIPIGKLRFVEEKDAPRQLRDKDVTCRTCGRIGVIKDGRCVSLASCLPATRQSSWWDRLVKVVKKDSVNETVTAENCPTSPC